MSVPLFQSTPSAWRETCVNPSPVQEVTISIHSLRMEGDKAAMWEPVSVRNFNPLPPHGGRHENTLLELAKRNFNPLPPHGGRPPMCGMDGGSREISIHSLRMEGDDNIWIYRMLRIHFNPLPPHGGRPGLSNRRSHLTIFQSTPSAWRETFVTFPSPTWEESFQSTPSAWRETTSATA